MKNLFISFSLLFSVITSYSQVSIHGKIQSKSETDLSQVIIQIEGTAFQTNSSKEGFFYFSQLKPGKYQLVITGSGFELSKIHIILPQDSMLSIQLVPISKLTEEVLISATRANTNSGMTYSELNKSQLEKLNLGQDVPYLLQSLPSVVVSSDAGTGVGYTGIRIRGSDPTRINVCINGIPINDAESQQMYWVDLPDIISSTDNIQVQRGVGTSSNGSGSFGGSINLLSSKLSNEPFAQTTNSYGSFNTIKNMISIGTGRLNEKWSFEGRLSKIISDGYIDRGSSNLKSYFLAGAYTGKSTALRFNIFSGNEITYQSWNGIPESRYKNDEQGMLNYISSNFLDEEEAANLLNAGRTYNYFTYDQQVDDYKQNHYQLFFSQVVNKFWIANLALHYTKGKGFYEEFKKNQTLADYSITPNDTANTTSDLIRRKWLDNDFYGTVFSLQGDKWKIFKPTIGGAYNQYEGGHFGEVIWARNAINSDIRQRYYDDNAKKTDFNIYLKADIEVQKNVFAYLDFQFRQVIYSFNGPDKSGDFTLQEQDLGFFNPKAGLTYRPFNNHEFRASISIAHKEPNRDDYIESTTESKPKAEQLTDYEIGYKFHNSRFWLAVNGYYMNYKDQLILTGAVNDVGNFTRTNIKSSYRAGIETELGITICRKLKFEGNITLSRNKIKNFYEYLDAYDLDFNYIGQEKKLYNTSDISFSPSVIACGILSWNVLQNMEVKFIAKNIGQQFLDNTSTKARSLSAYTVCDLRLNFTAKNIITKEISFNLLVNNIFSELYASNGYTYGYIFDNNRIDENFYYPQAQINFLGQIMVKF